MITNISYVLSEHANLVVSINFGGLGPGEEIVKGKSYAMWIPPSFLALVITFRYNLIELMKQVILKLMLWQNVSSTWLKDNLWSKWSNFMDMLDTSTRLLGNWERVSNQ